MFLIWHFQFLPSARQGPESPNSAVGSDTPGMCVTEKPLRTHRCLAEELAAPLGGALAAVGAALLGTQLLQPRRRLPIQPAAQLQESRSRVRHRPAAAPPFPSPSRDPTPGVVMQSCPTMKIKAQAILLFSMLPSSSKNKEMCQKCSAVGTPQRTTSTCCSHSITPRTPSSPC